ncbi:hypothetical protein D187_010458 [Cystobacter fuscus DSM 2262]|uniref:Uncharacterized protein n=1 Tax=Cystobacter fuscus (strain ATCC 25194 / DSM 2262 / NBRC 100088 / M29) TaxID=1242864 RepID=S9QKM5_CYSF2|nr:hypothetical protein D187_010458 [Cystobacter fuscus DSM 2262]
MLRSGLVVFDLFGHVRGVLVGRHRDGQGARPPGDGEPGRSPPPSSRTGPAPSSEHSPIATHGTQPTWILPGNVDARRREPPGRAPMHPRPAGQAPFSSRARAVTPRVGPGSRKRCQFERVRFHSFVTRLQDDDVFTGCLEFCRAR